MSHLTHHPFHFDVRFRRRRNILTISRYMYTCSRKLRHRINLYSTYLPTQRHVSDLDRQVPMYIYHIFEQNIAVFPLIIFLHMFTGNFSPCVYIYYAIEIDELEFERFVIELCMRYNMFLYCIHSTLYYKTTQVGRMKIIFNENNHIRLVD